MLAEAFTGNNDWRSRYAERRGFDLAIRVLAAAAGLVLLLLAAAYAVVAASLPRRGGEAPLPGLAAPRDASRSIRARSRPCAASRSSTCCARQGYLHAQERFFQMDLLRRSSAGELAELFGERALAADLGQRPFGYRERARALRVDAAGRAIAWLDAYTEGVNAGLADLGARPPEYWLAGAAPRRWLPEDTLLVVLTFYTMLSNNESYERAQGVMHAVLPPPLYDFLTPSTSRFDRPVLGSDAERSDGRLRAAADPGPRRRRPAHAARAGRAAARRASSRRCSAPRRTTGPSTRRAARTAARSSRTIRT